MKLEMVKEYPKAERGTLNKFVHAMAEYVYEHPEVLDRDEADGKFFYFKIGPYCDSAQACRTAKTLCTKGERYGGSVEAFPKRIDGDDYVLARFFPSVRLKLVEKPNLGAQILRDMHIENSLGKMRTLPPMRTGRLRDSIGVQRRG